MTYHTSLKARWSTVLGNVAAGALALGVLVPTLAHAHFVQQQPPNWAAQDSLGLPQKSAPCGQADPGTAAVPSNMVTTYTAGQTITVTINETVFHPGHYRVLLAKDQASLPADPAVTAGATPCGSTTITANPTPPLLADGQLLHSTAYNAPQSFQVTLPAGYTCTNCTLQVVQFMSSHALNNPGGCFYHHCANVNIVAAGTDLGTGVTDGGVADASTGTPDGSTTTPPGSTATGCGYYIRTAAVPAAPLLAGTFLLGLVLLRRRRSAAK